MLFRLQTGWWRAPGVGASGRAAARRRPIVAGDFAVAFGSTTPAGQAGVGCAMSVPLLAFGELLGTLSFGSAEPALRFGCEELAALIEVQGTLIGSSGWWSRDARQDRSRLAQLAMLYEGHHRTALGLAWALLGDRVLAEHVVEKALLSAWRAGVVAQASPGRDRPWLMALVRRRAAEFVGLHQDSQRGPLRTRQIDETSGVVELVCVGRLSCAEAAEWLGMPVPRVRALVRQALDVLRAHPPRGKRG